jgi:hypothetical protein
MDMPLCHNLIEAMSRGAVPILEHPELLTPPLQHNVNCLVFRGSDSLREVMEHAFHLSESEIARLRKGVHAYYLQHHSPGAFAKRLLTHPAPTVEVFLNAWRTPRPLEQEFCN